VLPALELAVGAGVLLGAAGVSCGPSVAVGTAAAAVAVGEAVCSGGEVGPRLGAGETVVHAETNRHTTRARKGKRRPIVTEVGVIAELWTTTVDICFFTVCHLVASRSRPNVLFSGTAKHRFSFPLPPSERGAPIGQAPLVLLCPVRLRQSTNGDCFLRRDVPPNART
jgi:hypothetical protein